MKEEKYIVFDIETTGLNPFYGDIVTCICAKTNDGQEFKKIIRCQAKTEEVNERLLIQCFFNWLYQHCEYKLISKNGKGFDVPFLLARTLLLGVKDYGVILDMEHFDLQDITKKRISLSDMAILLGVENKSANGLQAIEWFKNKEFDKLVEYCMQDVNVTEQVYLTWKKLQMKPKNNPGVIVQGADNMEV